MMRKATMAAAADAGGMYMYGTKRVPLLPMP